MGRMGRFSTFCASAARGAPHWQHDGDAAVTHGRTPVERSAHRAPSKVRPSHVVRAEQVGRGGPAHKGAVWHQYANLVFSNVLPFKDYTVCYA